tara:strand:- start:603 stop:758 length:156 start_codon:yes stop_codon:yes gene_type:complete
MSTIEAMQVLWVTLSGYAEECLPDDSDELKELQQAWTLVSDKMIGIELKIK